MTEILFVGEYMMELHSVTGNRAPGFMKRFRPGLLRQDWEKCIISIIKNENGYFIVWNTKGKNGKLQSPKNQNSINIDNNFFVNDQDQIILSDILILREMSSNENKGLQGTSPFDGVPKEIKIDALHRFLYDMNLYMPNKHKTLSKKVTLLDDFQLNELKLYEFHVAAVRAAAAATEEMAKLAAKVLNLMDMPSLRLELRLERKAKDAEDAEDALKAAEQKVLAAAAAAKAARVVAEKALKTAYAENDSYTWDWIDIMLSNMVNPAAEEWSVVAETVAARAAAKEKARQDAKRSWATERSWATARTARAAVARVAERANLKERVEKAVVVEEADGEAEAEEEADGEAEAEEKEKTAGGAALEAEKEEPRQVARVEAAAASGAMVEAVHLEEMEVSAAETLSAAAAAAAAAAVAWRAVTRVWKGMDESKKEEVVKNWPAHVKPTLPDLWPAHVKPTLPDLNTRMASAVAVMEEVGEAATAPETSADEEWLRSLLFTFNIARMKAGGLKTFTGDKTLVPMRKRDVPKAGGTYKLRKARKRKSKKVKKPKNPKKSRKLKDLKKSRKNRKSKINKKSRKYKY